MHCSAQENKHCVSLAFVYRTQGQGHRGSEVGTAGCLSAFLGSLWYSRPQWPDPHQGRGSLTEGVSVLCEDTPLQMMRPGFFSLAWAPLLALSLRFTVCVSSHACTHIRTYACSLES